MGRRSIDAIMAKASPSIRAAISTEAVPPTVYPPAMQSEGTAPKTEAPEATVPEATTSSSVQPAAKEWPSFPTPPPPIVPTWAVHMGRIILAAAFLLLIGYLVHHLHLRRDVSSITLTLRW